MDLDFFKCDSNREMLYECTKKRNSEYARHLYNTGFESYI